MSHAVAHISAVGLYGCRLQSAAGEDAFIRLVHRPIALVSTFGIGVEAVCILHDELLRAHQTETRTRLITELRLDLVDRDGELTVGGYRIRHEIRHLFLCGGAHGHHSLGAVLEAEHVRAHRIPTASLLPKFGRLQRGHENLKRTSGIHLLTHDVLDLAESAYAERHEREKPGRRLTADAGSYEQLVRIDLRILRILSQCLDECLGPLHFFDSQKTFR